VTVNSSAAFGCEMSRLKKGLGRRTLGRMILVGLVVFLALFAVATGIAKTGIWQPQRRELAVIGLFVFSVCFALIHTALKRRSFIDRLIEIDRRLGLHDRISTAYEYHRAGWASELSELLIADAAGTLSRLNHRQIFPRRPAVLSAVLVGLLALNAVLLSIDHLATGARPATPHSQELAALRTSPQVYTDRQHRTSSAADNASQNDLSQKLQNVVERLNQTSMTADDMLQSLDSILNEVHAAQRRLAQELSQNLGAAGLEEMAVQAIREPYPDSLRELNRLQEMLGQLFDGEIPEDIQRNLEALKEHLGLEETLSQLIDELNTRRAEPSDSTEKLTGAAVASHDAESRHDRGSQLHSVQTLGEQASSGSGSGVSARSDAEADTDAQRDGGPDDVSISAGRQKGSDRKTAAYELQTAKGPALRDQDRSTAGKNYRLLIRSSAAFNRAESDEQDIIRPYRQEVESILRKEDIPPNYREYIKNYFLAIGLRTEEKTHDPHP
jgi:hypothetical protein